VEAGHDIAQVVTRPDARRSRRAGPTPSPVKALAVDLGLTVSDRVEAVAEVGAELGVVVAYGRIIRPPVLGSLRLINVHFSLLPRWRGAAPVERAILAGDDTTGVCLMQLEAGLDTGPVFARRRSAIGDGETAAQLTARLADLGARLLVGALADGLGEPQAQYGEATYAAKLEPAELELRWDRPAVDLVRLVRVGRAWTTWRGRRLLVLAASLDDPAAPASSEEKAGTLLGTRVVTGAGALDLLRVQPEARGPLDAVEWLNGARPGADERLGG